MNSKMKGFVKGLALGLAGKPLEFAPGKEPVAYLYNGVRLPKLPDTDCPYKVIGKHTYPSGEVYYYFVAKNEPFTATNDVNISFMINAPVMYRIPDGQAAWESIGTVGLTLEYVWSNHDVYDANDSTVLYHEATEPVPIYE